METYLQFAVAILTIQFWWNEEWDRDVAYSRKVCLYFLTPKENTILWHVHNQQQISGPDAFAHPRQSFDKPHGTDSVSGHIRCLPRLATLLDKSIIQYHKCASLYDMYVNLRKANQLFT